LEQLRLERWGKKEERKFKNVNMEIMSAIVSCYHQSSVIDDISFYIVDEAKTENQLDGVVYGMEGIDG
jgi:hypothetical protein